MAYQRLVSDSEHAEAYVHTLLERRGYRLSERREFFNAPLHVVVEALYTYPDDARSAATQGPPTPVTQTGDTGDDFLDGLSITDQPAWQEVFEEAMNYDYGLDDQIQDPAEAFRLYKQAAHLNCLMAYRRLGDLYHQGRGTARSDEQALAHYKKAAALGEYLAYADMATLFRIEGHAENQAKCWRRFIDAIEADAERARRDPVVPFKITVYLADTLPGTIYGEKVVTKFSPVVLEEAQTWRESCAKDPSAMWRLESIDRVIAWLDRARA